MRTRALVLTALSIVTCGLVGGELLGRAHSGGLSEPPGTKTAAPSPLVLSPPLATRTEVTTPFRVPNAPYGPGHRGVDLLGNEGQPVHAAAAGTVLHAGVVVDRPVVSVEHDNGLRTTYEPVRPRVSEGQPVRRGQLIGVLVRGHPDCTSTPPHTCLHWGLRSAEKYLDPLERLASPSGRTRLLPW
ncbi:murein DD-endopeptidase MepM/ murein hydrolase activator NlpD [Actinopolyspora biskrensis]|uniref:Murein DD-endopeptidase MepM/ murein hydrolase activator NlpD n=1 Tax=Actinopolyspora biskrensis TaxID=1470178 RepID=A0A852YV23_9ACTN|nr:M23 family metallopeptidase [Actinopolyspora biskrensis]NYH77910.1 murein DD-endopeptidase MepM/ murein hydrolase activator NlpD [Actinopolyspora biskrensis]